MFSTIMRTTCIIFLSFMEYVYSGCCCCNSNQKSSSSQTNKGSKGNKGNNGSNPPIDKTKIVIDKNEEDIITFTCHWNSDEWVTCDSLNIVENSKDTAKTFINENFLCDTLLVFKLDNESFKNILNNKTKFVYNDFQDTEDIPFIIAVVELCNGNYYLFCALDTIADKGNVQLFKKMKELKKIKILKSGKIENCYSMFLECTNLEYLDACELKTKEVKSVGSMFAFCTALKYLDISNFNIGKAGGCGTMFASCNSLEEVRTKDEKIIQRIIVCGMKEVSNGLYRK